MVVTNKPEPLQFDINAAVVFRLGEELITDVVQALVELVKNSYDADATWVNITINTTERNQWGRQYANATGSILVEDDGHGMDRTTIQRGWLTIANSPKREAKAAGEVTKLGRTPLGDKGLGRLSSQRLARNVEIITTYYLEQTIEYYVAFSWTDFHGTNNLRDVPLTFMHDTVPRVRPGTKLILSDLREPEIWKAERQLQDLQRKLSGMISPFQEARDFHVHLQVDGKSIQLAEIALSVRNTARLRYSFEFDGEIFRISGLARLNYFQPNKEDDRKLFALHCQIDRGKALYEFLASKTRKRRPSHFKLSESPEWFIEFGTQRALIDLDKVRLIDGSPVSPGPFRGEVDAVSLDSSDFEGSVISRQSEFRRLVRDLAGIRVYRDGFGIRVGEDWLGLGRQWTGGTSYYGLRPGNVLGYVAISARDNPDLLETTNREGFQVTSHYDNFLGLLSEFVRFSGNSQEYLRRGFLEFLNVHRDQSAGVGPQDTHPTITRRIDDVARSLSSEKRKVQRHSGSLRQAAEGAAKTLGHVRNQLRPDVHDKGPVSSALENLEKEIEGVSSAASKAEKMLDEVSATLDQSSELTTMREVLDRRWEMVNDHLSILYESVSLGLTAEALSHEIHNIADRLAKRSAALLRELKGGARSSSTVEYIEHVRSSVAAMRIQLAHLTPSLRYLRERRERIDVLSWLKEFAKFYNHKGSSIDIKVIVQGTPNEFSVNVNQGKLTQVFDNLVLNAEYWLKEALRLGSVNNGKITIAVEGPIVRVMDNGRGVEESVEEALFEPFVTTKRTGEGRGLGLFVVRQLLDSESCEISLLPDRNEQGRRYIFELDLSGAVSE